MPNPFRYPHKQLVKKAAQIRLSLMKAIINAGSGHPAGSLGISDIITALFFRQANIQPKNPLWPGRDRIVLSAGHLAPALYSAMAHAGYFEVDDFVKNLRKFGSPFQGHPHRLSLAGVEISSGPLGQGISQAIGMTIALKHDKNPAHVWCITSDGEHQQGQTWEALLFAGTKKISNLTIIVDRNYIQIGGPTEDNVALEDLARKYQSFNFKVIIIDGHNFRQINKVIERAREGFGWPAVIIAKTMPGKGIDFMEDDFRWHGKAPAGEEAKKAIAQLKKKAEKNG